MDVAASVIDFIYKLNNQLPIEVVDSSDVSAIPHLKQFFFDAVYYFYFDISLACWSFQYEVLQAESIVFAWLRALDCAYSNWLNQEAVQRWIGSLFNQSSSAHTENELLSTFFLSRHTY